MQRQRGELVPIGDAVSGLDDVAVPAIRCDSPQARHHFTQADQVNQLPRRITTSARINFEHRKGTAWEPRSRTALIMSYPSALGTADAPLRKNNLRHATGRHS